MKYEELKNLSAIDLKAKETQLRADLFGLKIKNKTSQLTKKTQIKSTRRDIARVLTAMNAK